MKGFLRAGHTPTLVAALLYFDVSFMAWVLLGPLAPFLRAELGLSATEQGLVTAFLYWVDRCSGRCSACWANASADDAPGCSARS
ncbi:MAG TPA: hypothetical protein VFB92_24055 [Vicinamibacterales bacterium]|nr:hypothetical protein [Vicinamibacterales bacterium]